MSNEVELINLTNSNGIDEFASEQPGDRHRSGAEPRRAAAESRGTTASAPRRRSTELRRSANASAPEPLDAFQGEVLTHADVYRPADVFVSMPHSAVPLHSRSRVAPVAIVAVAGMAAVFAVVLAQRSNVDIGNPIASLVSPAVQSLEALPALPPPVTPAPALSTMTPSPSVESSARAATPDSPHPAIAEPEPEPPAAPEPRAAAVAPASTPPRLPRPLSQDPARLPVSATPPSAPPRLRVEPPSTPPPSTANVSPPASAPAPVTPVASAVSSPPPPSLAAPPSLPAVPPPTAAAASTSVSTTAPAAASTPAPAAAPPVASAASAAVIDGNTTGVQNALSRYRRAFNALDAGAAREVWPTVNERTLSRAFERLERQDVSFESCQLDVQNERAEARCSGTARYVPRVGSRTPRVERREWRFSLVKSRDEWLIGAVEAR